MQDFRYLSGVSTLSLDPDACSGCGVCTAVCPHGVLVLDGRRVRIADHDGCMECGACAQNCPTAALRVTPGVGCAAAIIQTWLKRKGAGACGTSGCC